MCCGGKSHGCSVVSDLCWLASAQAIKRRRGSSLAGVIAGVVAAWEPGSLNLRPSKEGVLHVTGSSLAIYVLSMDAARRVISIAVALEPFGRHQIPPQFLKFAKDLFMTGSFRILDYMLRYELLAILT